MTAEKFAVIILPQATEGFDYIVPEGMSLLPGDCVKVPFRRGESIGMVRALSETTKVPLHKMKPLIGRVTSFSVSKEQQAFMAWVARYTCSPLGAIFKMCIPDPKVLSEEQSPPSQNCDSPVYQPVTLRPEQQAAASNIQTFLQAQKFHPIVLDGVTGSGKTEVYFEAINEVLHMGKQALVLLPEIALSTAWLSRFEARFGCPPTLWHSGLTPKQRRLNWQAIANGSAPVIVGARSALFLPYKRLGVIIVDEEHDPSFKQETGVCYHARDMAVVRAQHAACPIVLSSATPSLESLQNVALKQYTHLQLTSRHGGASLPSVQVVDVRKFPAPKNTFISAPLWRAMEETIAKGQQVLLFLNRRGYAPTLLCRACGHQEGCQSCDFQLVVHQKKQRLMCHHCGYGVKIPLTCGECGTEGDMIPFGPGVERIEEEVQQRFPSWRTQVMTSDTMGSEKKAKVLLKAIEQNEVDVIIGTQTMTKGYHFPNLTLVGIIDADLGRAATDVRGAERTYQMLHQVAGRAGRSALPGQVLIQTHMPTHPILEALVRYDREGFLDLERADREMLGLPPYGRLTAVIISSTKRTEGEDFVKALARQFPKSDSEIQLLGPVPAPLHYLKKWYRWRLLVKSPKSLRHQPIIKQWLEGVQAPSHCKIQVDIDPQSFY